jgi:hypothetical protein
MRTTLEPHAQDGDTAFAGCATRCQCRWRAAILLRQGTDFYHHVRSRYCRQDIPSIETAANFGGRRRRFKCHCRVIYHGLRFRSRPQTLGHLGAVIDLSELAYVGSFRHPRNMAMSTGVKPKADSC